MKRSAQSLALTLALMFSVNGHAALIVGEASLDAAQEVPSGASSATGSATVIADTNALSVSISMSVIGIDLANITFPGGGLAFGAIGPVHIHTGIAGTNGPVVVPFATASDYTATASGFDLASTVTLSALDFANFINRFSASATYINIHSLSSPSGEIRGQIRVPEPSALVILFLGLVGLAFTRRRSTAS